MPAPGEQLPDDLDIAADRLDELEREVARLREALEPFAAVADKLKLAPDDARLYRMLPVPGIGRYASVTVGDLRRARAALSETSRIERRPLKCHGVGRDKDCISALQFYFSRCVTDDEMRFLHDVIKRAVACIKQAGPKASEGGGNED